MEAFTEKQNFLKRWKLLAIPVIIAGFVPMVFTINKAPVLFAVVMPVIVAVLVLVLFALLTLHTRIDQENIAVKFSPFHSRYKLISWNDVQSAAVVKYNPLFEYGGWGYRKGWSRKKIAYNISGNMGLELELTDGKKVMIGTDRKEEMVSYLDYLKSKHEIAAIQ